MPQPLMLKKLKLNDSVKYLEDFLELTPKKKKICPFHHRGLEIKARSQEIPEVVGKFGLGVQNEGQKLLQGKS